MTHILFRFAPSTGACFVSAAKSHRLTLIPNGTSEPLLRLALPYTRTAQDHMLMYDEILTTSPGWGAWMNWPPPM
jgi:hypothetical protein